VCRLIPSQIFETGSPYLPTWELSPLDLSLSNTAGCSAFIVSPRNEDRYMAASLKVSAEAAAIDLPEQIHVDIRTSIGQIRQLRWSGSFINSPQLDWLK
jgi:hypothetical protein